jgi:phosphate transport system substrate-binding protein
MSDQGSRAPEEKMMFKKLAVALAATLLASATAVYAGVTINGAGATAPFPVYSKWAEAYKAKTGTQLNYQPIGSGGGIKQIEAKTVDFGASDKNLPMAELNSHGLLQFPTVIVGITPVVNLPGVGPGQINLTGPVLAEIYLGNIKRWADPKIQSLNPTHRLPNLPITVVHRSDGSGTTFLYTSYLKAVSPDWAKVGASDSVQWPVGQGGKGNDGVAAFVKNTPGSIGYVEYAFAKSNNLAYTNMADREGHEIAPTEDSFKAAAANAVWTSANGFAPSLLNQPGANAWPISGATYILIYKDQTSPTGGEVLKFFDWSYTNGDGLATSLAYVPLPASVKAAVRQAWKTEVKLNGKPAF